LILGVGVPVLWEAVSWGTRTWVKYKLLKEPLPSITTFLPMSMIQPLIALTLVLVLAFVAISAIVRTRRLFGIIPPTELTRHLVLLGPTGSGKTTVAKAIIAKTLKSLKPPTIIVIDWKGEYKQFLSMATVVRKVPNIWDVPGDSPREKALAATELIREMSKDVIEITPASSLLLLRVLTEEYEKGMPTTEKIMRILERYAEVAQREGRYAESNMYLALVRRLFILLVDEERKVENEIADDSKIIIYDLGSMPSIHLKTLYANYVLMSIYRESTKAKADGLKAIVVAEEAQNYIHGRRLGELPTIAERIVYELRSYGVGVILVCPDPELLPAPVLKDVGAVVSMGPDSLPRFALERHLFRASLEEAEKMLKELKKAKMIVYYRGNLNFLRRLPKPPKVLRLKPKPKGDRMGVTDLGAGGRSSRAWPILPHRSPGRPKVVEVKEEVEEKPKVIEVKVAEERTEAEPKAVEAEKPKVAEEPLRLEEEEYEEPEIEVKEPEPTETEPIEEKKVEEPTVEVKEEIEEKLTEEMPLEEPEPASKGPPIPSLLPYRVKPAALPSRAPYRIRTVPLIKRGEKWWVSGRVGTEIPCRGSAHPRRRAGQSGAPA
jgi:energy-coupling factor transporter ATP-binding protein EcfA2